MGALKQIEVITSPSTWMRHEPVRNVVFRSAEPYNRIVSLGIEDHYIELPPCVPDEEILPERNRHTLELPLWLTRRLSQYALQLVARDSLRADKGNCHDFTMSMLGYDVKDWKEATVIVSKEREDAAQVSVDVSTIDLGIGLIVAHPDYEIAPPPHYPYFDNYAPPPIGHGPIHTVHSGLSVGELEDGGSWVLHRIAMGGALALDPLSKFRSAYDQSPQLIPLDHWRDGIRPTPDDMHLFQMA